MGHSRGGAGGADEQGEQEEMESLVGTVESEMSVSHLNGITIHIGLNT